MKTDKQELRNALQMRKVEEHLSKFGYTTLLRDKKLYLNVVGTVVEGRKPRDAKCAIPNFGKLVEVSLRLPEGFLAAYTGVVSIQDGNDRSWHEILIYPLDSLGVLDTSFEPRLSPCPFCGSEEVREVTMGVESFEVQCTNCPAFTWGPSAEDAVRSWNRRPE